MKQRNKSGMLLWTLEGNPVRGVCECSSLDERLGGALAGTKEYDVDDLHVTKVTYRRDDTDTLITRMEQNGA